MAVRFSRCLSSTIFALVFMVCFCARTSLAVLRIDPAYVNVALDKGRPSGVFTLTNLGDTEERWRLKASHFTISVDGRLSLSKTGEHSLAPWLFFNPKEVRLPPKSRRVVRFTVVPRGRLQEGEYWAAMELESLKAMASESKDATSGRTVSVRAVISVVVPIFATMGTPSYEGLIKEVALVRNNEGGVSLTALVAATGTGRLKVNGTYSILTEAGQIVAEDRFGGGAFICRGGERLLKTDLKVDLPEQAYMAKLTLRSFGMPKPMTKVAQVVCPKLPPKPQGDTIETAVNDSKNPKDPKSPKDSKSQSQTGGSKEAVDEKGGMESSSTVG